MRCRLTPVVDSLSPSFKDYKLLSTIGVDGHPRVSYTSVRGDIISLIRLPAESKKIVWKCFQEVSSTIKIIPRITFRVISLDACKVNSELKEKSHYPFFSFFELTKERFIFEPELNMGLPKMLLVHHASAKAFNFFCM